MNSMMLGNLRNVLRETPPRSLFYQQLMRILERLQFASGLVVYILFFLAQMTDEEDVPVLDVERAKLPMLIVTCISIVLGHYIEGFRIHQVPFFIGLIVHSGFAWVLEHPSRVQLVNIIATILLMGSVILSFLFGESNLARIKLTGHFEVGHREFRATKLGSEVSVYYPVDRFHFKKNISRSRNTAWLRHGDKTLLGLVKASVPYGREDPPPACVFRYMRNIKLMTLDQGDVAEMFVPQGAKESQNDLEKGQQAISDRTKSKGDQLSPAAHNQSTPMEVESPPSYPLIPLIFSHGLSSNRTMHSGLCRDLASHGYLVFAPDHMDRTSSYYETEDGQGYYYCNKRTAHDMAVIAPVELFLLTKRRPQLTTIDTYILGQDRFQDSPSKV
ncbi:hypothetical protein FGO68_gene15043 [Halteria grandinella]|uniref:1-alkyl-2-acetylglycerophosphocholine esterase n=1 Tax=Halteria grandinella TaxID=5974 RepID=A0A8J8NE69_HALGN|nr:hypothetical protein FGO68_gene15043 [Halteria grandinella]